MRGRQPATDITIDSDDRLQRRVRAGKLGHGRTRDVLHRDEHVLPVLPKIVHGHDVGVLELRKHLRLAGELHGRAFVASQTQLERNVSIEHGIPGLEHDPVPAFAEHAQEFEPPQLNQRMVGVEAADHGRLVDRLREPSPAMDGPAVGRLALAVRVGAQHS
jgi:hypothetical protein